MKYNRIILFNKIVLLRKRGREMSRIHRIFSASKKNGCLFMVSERRVL